MTVIIYLSLLEISVAVGLMSPVDKDCCVCRVECDHSPCMPQNSRSMASAGYIHVVLLYSLIFNNSLLLTV